MSGLSSHLDACGECQVALAAHDLQAPVCGDEGCFRIAYCLVGARLREAERNIPLDNVKAKE